MDMKVTKINYQPQINKPSCTQRIKHFFTRNPHGIKIKVLLEDVFDSTINRTGWLGYLRQSRDLPNCVSGPEEDYSYTDCGRVLFYPEDEQKMSKMTPRERVDYGSELIEQGRYIE